MEGWASPPLVSGASLASLFATHPPIAKRIERLIGEEAAGFYSGGSGA